MVAKIVQCVNLRRVVEARQQHRREEGGEYEKRGSWNGNRRAPPGEKSFDEARAFSLARAGEGGGGESERKFQAFGKRVHAHEFGQTRFLVVDCRTGNADFDMSEQNGIGARLERAVLEIDDLFASGVAVGCHTFEYFSTRRRSWLRARCKRDRTVPIEQPMISEIS